VNSPHAITLACTTQPFPLLFQPRLLTFRLSVNPLFLTTIRVNEAVRTVNRIGKTIKAMPGISIR
jgi:hypothetical protein